MKRSILSLILIMIVFRLSSQSYQFDSIPENLKRGADAVIRSHQDLFTLIKPGNAVHREKKIITLLNENAAPYRKFSVSYNKFSKINFLRGFEYDEKGEIIKTLGSLDIQDRSVVNGGAFYSDERVEVLYFPKHKYPYTIEVEYEEEFSSLINYPEFEFQESPDVSVEKSGIQIVVPNGMEFRHLTERLRNPVDSVMQDNVTIYTWQEENIPAAQKRLYTYVAKSLPPTLYTAPVDFEFGGYKGSMRSWKEFGDWDYSLIKGRDQLNEEQKRKVAEIVKNAKDDREKTRLIYEYMQSSTRYVLIDIGIGGFQPAEASAVAKSGFGDCKALVNYTKSLLAAAGITSYYTLVMAGDNDPIDPDFVINHFNHIILSVPMPKDTVWLECTNQTMPFNYLAETDNHYALMITPEGGKLVRTPAFQKGENVICRTGSVSLNNFGKSTVKLADNYSGVHFFAVNSIYGLASDEELKRILGASLKFSDINATSVKYTENRSEKPSAVFAWEAAINDFASIAGKMMIFSPAFTKVDYLQDLPMELELKHYYIWNDSVTYNLPIGFKVDFKPSDVKVQNEFGRFSYTLEAKNDKLLFKRNLELNMGKIPVTKFEAFRSFINTVAKTDREMIVLKN